MKRLKQQYSNIKYSSLRFLSAYSVKGHGNGAYALAKMQGDKNKATQNVNT